MGPRAGKLTLPMAGFRLEPTFRVLLLALEPCMNPLGQLAEYIEKNRMHLALVQGENKGKLALITAADRQAALPAKRVLLFTPSAMDPERPRQAIVDYLQEVEARREDLAAQVDVPGLWELTNAESETVPPRDLAELVFGMDAGDDHVSAVLRALFYERLHFKLSGGEFQPFSPEQLEQKRLQQEREESRRREVDQAVAWLKGLKASQDQAGPPPGDLLGLLRELVIHGEEAAEAKKAKEIVSLAELGGQRQVFKLLVRLGEFSPHENLPLLREGVPVDFPETALTEAAGLDASHALDQDREDLRELFTFTIDGAFTTDFDDALSYEPRPGGGGVLGVHITDAAALLPPGGALEEEARLRGTTLYMPDDRVPMLPPSLSEDALSLRQGMARPAISVLAELDASGGLDSFRVCRSVIQVHQRLTYDQADEMIPTDPRLGGLHAICDSLRQARARTGAYFLPLPEVIVGVDQDWQVQVKVVDRDSASREMVAETAIWANLLFGRYLMEADAPALYRVQAEPKEPFQEGDPSDLFLHFSQRRLLNRVEIVTSPGRHSSLGAETYTHATSPIRRYLDLVMQRQLGGVLSGAGPVYDARGLEELAMEVGPNVRRAMRVRQARQRYWLIHWLGQRREQEIRAMVMEYQTRRWQLLLPEVMMLTAIPNQPGLKLEPGQEVMVRLEKVDAFFDQLRVSLA